MIAVIIIIIGYTLLNGGSEEEYQNKVAAKRNEKLSFLKSSDQSPFELNNIEYIEPTYYPITKEYKVRAKLQRLTNIQRVVIQNNDGSTDVFVKFAIANFKMKGQEFQLLILKATGFGSMNNYFTGFADLTSGKSTYGGGRYLDLEIGNSDNITIDFNLAYNPYCAYAPGYTCPLPPSENILNIAIEAGEKDYKH